MCGEHSLAVRRAILARLKHDIAVTSLVDPASIYPGTVPANPAWPFVRYSTAISTPFVASGLNSSKIDTGLHAFSKPAFDAAGRMIATAEDVALRLANAMATALDGAIMPLAEGWKARTIWIRTRSIQDRGEASAWHVIVAVRTEVAG